MAKPKSAKPLRNMSKQAIADVPRACDIGDIVLVSTDTTSTPTSYTVDEFTHDRQQLGLMGKRGASRTLMFDGTDWTLGYDSGEGWRSRKVYAVLLDKMRAAESASIVEVVGDTDACVSTFDPVAVVEEWSPWSEWLPRTDLPPGYVYRMRTNDHRGRIEVSIDAAYVDLAGPLTSLQEAITFAWRSYAEHIRGELSKQTAATARLDERLGQFRLELDETRIKFERNRDALEWIRGVVAPYVRLEAVDGIKAEVAKLAAMYYRDVAR